MKLYVVTIGGKVHPECFVSLRGACGVSGISYSAASHGRLHRFDSATGILCTITAVTVVKIKGRGSLDPGSRREF